MNQKKTKSNSQSFSSQMSTDRIKPLEQLRDISSKKNDLQKQKAYTSQQVQDMLMQEEKEKERLLQTNYQLQRKQALDFFKNDLNYPQSARPSNTKHLSKMSEPQQQQNHHLQTIDERQSKNSRNFMLNIQDSSSNLNEEGSSLATALKTVTIDSNLTKGAKSHQQRSNTRLADQPPKFNGGMHATQNSAGHSKHQTASLETPTSTFNKVSTPQHQMNGNPSSRKTQVKHQNFQSFNIPQSQTQDNLTVKYESNNSAGTNAYNPQIAFNPNTASYSQSLQFYENQYREKLRELDQEKRSRKAQEDKVEELEGTLREIMEENVKLKDELKECVTDNNILTQHFQQMQDQQKAHEPYTSEIEERNIKLNMEIFTLKEEIKMITEEKFSMQRKNASLSAQIEEILKENHRWKEQHDQLKERMQSLRGVNKQLENKANQNWMMLRRNDLFKEYEDRMLKAESRVKELEESLAQFIEDFETLNSDLTICAQKLALAESRVELLTKKNFDIETQNEELLDKIGKIKKPPPKTVKVNLCAHYEGQGKGFNSEEFMKLLETQNLQIMTLTKTMEALRKENKDYFQKTMDQQETIFTLQTQVNGYEGSKRASNVKKSEQSLKFDYSQSNHPLQDTVSPKIKQFSVSSSQEMQLPVRQKPFMPYMGSHSSSQYDNVVDEQQEYKAGSTSVRSAVKEFSFKNQSRGEHTMQFYKASPLHSKVSPSKEPSSNVSQASNKQKR